MSIAKPSQVIQRESGSPSEFCERLCEAYRLYTPIDPARGCWVSDGDKCSLVSLAYPENVRWGDTWDELSDSTAVYTLPCVNRQLVGSCCIALGSRPGAL